MIVKILFLIFLFCPVYCREDVRKVVYLLPEEYKYTKDDLEINFIDVGQGDCTLVTTPCGKNLLIDAGGSPYWMGEDRWDPGENVVVPYLMENSIKTLDMLIVSHPHGDHFGGMFAVLNSVKVLNFIDNGYLEGDPDYSDLLKIVENKKIPYDQFKEGDTFEIEPNIFLIVYYPPRNGFPFEGANNSSIVAKIRYKNFSVLFPGDIEIEAENYICSKYKKELNSTVLKVPHHGSRTSSSVQFIKCVSPEVAVICCGKNNMFGHPHNEVVARYVKRKVDVYRTDLNGSIKVITNGTEYTVIPDRY